MPFWKFLVSSIHKQRLLRWVDVTNPRASIDEAVKGTLPVFYRLEQHSKTLPFIYDSDISVWDPPHPRPSHQNRYEKAGGSHVTLKLLQPPRITSSYGPLAVRCCTARPAAYSGQGQEPVRTLPLPIISSLPMKDTLLGAMAPG